ncbi:MAG: RNA polymerase sigma factor [Eubacterium sp.]
MEFEKLLAKNRNVVQRYISFRVSNKEDAEDLIQETFLTAYEKFSSLKNEEQFKPWLMSIAKNKCIDYYRKNEKNSEISYGDSKQILLPYEQYGISGRVEFNETLNSLNKNDREILILFCFIGYSQQEIAEKLQIPLGTVKSRLHTARTNFKNQFLYMPQTKSKGELIMKLPKIMPEYKIIKADKKPFSAKWEELMGWLIVPKINEKISWALYDFPNRNQTEYVEMEAVGKAEVHGIEGIEIVAKEFNPVASNIIDSDTYCERRFVAQLTDEYCRFLAESHRQNGKTVFHTFLDDDEFTKNWGYGTDNCGKETNIYQKGLINRTDDKINCEQAPCMDIAGRYTVIIGNREFDTVCVIDIESYDEGVLTEQFIDKNGKTVLWRRFNADDWKINHYNDCWSSILPNNEKIYVNGKAYIHWYDCISDYIL